MPEGRLIHVDIDEAADGTPVVVVTGDMLFQELAMDAAIAHDLGKALIYASGLILAAELKACIGPAAGE